MVAVVVLVVLVIIVVFVIITVIIVIILDKCEFQRVASLKIVENATSLK